MHEEILLNVTPQETRIAVVENGMLQELHIERARNPGLVGNVYLGVVERVLPGMQAAFVNIGLARTAFLHARDLLPGEDRDPDLGHGHMAALARLSEKQPLLVQVIRDPVGTKGARLTEQIAIPARNTVLLPKEDRVGISLRIRDTARRAELLEQLQAAAAGSGAGVILRTAGEHAPIEEIASEIRTLGKAWRNIVEQAAALSPPGLVHQDLPLATRLMRDLDWEKVGRVRIDSRETHRRIRDFMAGLVPEAAGRIELYPGPRPIFDAYGIEDEIDRALERKVSLKSGGYLVIDQTEAMTTIDVNTGSHVKGRTQEETLFRTNLEAASALARQLRLRNIGGIIVVDFIDMSVAEHVHQVMSALKRELGRDRSRTSVNDMTPLGLVEITRKRARDSLHHLLTEPCRTCAGSGYLKTPPTVCYGIFRELLCIARECSAPRCLVIASPRVIDQLLEEESGVVADLQDLIGGEITFQADSRLHQEKYDVVLL